MTIRPDSAPVKSPGTFGIDMLPRVARGEGSYIHDVSGKRYLDGSGGPAVYALGHANAEVNAAVAEQMDRIAHAYRYTFTSDAAEELAAILVDRTGLDHSMIVSSGSEAVESCLKVALQYHAARGEMSRRRFISRERSYHGNTLGALSVSGFKARRASYEGALMPASFVSAANVYRMPDGVDGEQALVPFLVRELEEEIMRQGPETIAAFIFEPVVGAAGGVVPAPPGYAKAVQEVCKRHGILLIADEVMSGSGRTGTWRALEQDGITPDIMSVAKGLAAGYAPLGAMLYSAQIAEALDATHGGIQSGHTFVGHTAACAAGVAVQKIIARENLLERVRTRGAALLQELRNEFADLPEVGDIRGRGYFIGLEIVADPETKVPFSPDLHVHAVIGRTAFANGLICYPCAGNVDGTAGDTVILAPPYTASDAELDELVALLSTSVREVIAGLRTA